MDLDEPIRWAQVLHDTPDLFPWVCLVLICIVMLSQHKRIIAYFDARIDAYGAKKQSDAVLAELIRNNTAALENNTAALNAVKSDRGETRRLLQYHENASAERMQHIQEVVNRIDATVTTNSKQIGLIEDRTEKRG